MDKFSLVCDTYLNRFAAYEALSRGRRADGPIGPDESAEIDQLSHQLARDLLTEVPSCGGTRTASTLLHRHPLHSRVLLRSAVMRHALVKPRGYAGDMDLMLMLCDLVPRGDSPFARAINEVFVRVPAAQAVRDRVAMLDRVLGQLPDGARVLNLACGPALEVQRLFAARPGTHLRIDLVDHDPSTLAYLRSRLPHPGVRVLAGNAFRILSGDLRVSSGRGIISDGLSLTRGYDLIYSAGLYDYIPDAKDGVGGAPQLTRMLFSLLNPGGRLLVGNYLKPSPTSRHQAHVRAMMELYAHWYLRYRSVDEIAGLASTIHAAHSLNLTDENGQTLNSDAGGAAIGFAAIQAA